MIEVTAVQSENFEAEVMQATQPVVVEFWTEGCKPCQKLGNVVRQYTDRLKIVTCNVDDNPEIVTKYGIMNVPTLMFFKNSQMVDRAIGYVNDISEAEVAAKCENVVNS